MYELDRYRIQTPYSVQIRETGMKVGVGLKPATSVFELKELLGTSSTGK
jgi:pentose-5-phosphate-3-epimerase